MPFGMKNAPTSFQWLIQQLTGDVVSCEGYIDDVEYIYTKQQAVKKGCGSKMPGLKWCEIKGGGQEMAVIIVQWQKI